MKTALPACNQLPCLPDKRQVSVRLTSRSVSRNQRIRLGNTCCLHLAKKTQSERTFLFRRRSVDRKAEKRSWLLPNFHFSSQFLRCRGLRVLTGRRLGKRRSSSAPSSSKISLKMSMRAKTRPGKTLLGFTTWQSALWKTKQPS